MKKVILCLQHVIYGDNGVVNFLCNYMLSTRYPMNNVTVQQFQNDQFLPDNFSFESVFLYFHQTI